MTIDEAITRALKHLEEEIAFGTVPTHEVQMARFRVVYKAGVAEGAWDVQKWVIDISTEHSPARRVASDIAAHLLSLGIPRPGGEG